MIALEILNERLGRLAGLACTEITAGMGVGTAVSLGFGPVIKRKTIETKRGPREVTIHQASIFVQDSTWRLEDSNSVICSSAADDNSPSSALVLGMNQLLDQKLAVARVYNTGLDLVLAFENGWKLLVFSVAVHSNLAAQNYSILTEQEILTVGFDATVETSQRDF